MYRGGNKMTKSCYKTLIFPILLLFLATALFGLKNHNLQQENFLPVCVLSVIFIVIQFICTKIRKGADNYLLSIIIFLSSISAIMILRLKPDLYMHQIMWIGIGLVVFLVITIFADKLLDLLDFPYVLGLGALIIICSVLIFGTDINGNRNWIILGPIQIQPSEFAKLFIIAFLSSFLSENKNMLILPSRGWKFIHLPPFRFLAPLLLIWSASILMFVSLKDLGSALLFFDIVVIMTYVATGKKLYVFLALFFFLLSSYISYLLFGHVQTRVAIWLHPWDDPMGSAYQIVQSLFAFSYGGIFGTGYSFGFPKLIPEVHTDFIFAAIGEEFGLIGVTFILLAYLLLFMRGMKIALSLTNEKYKLMAFGLAITMLLQTFIILAGVTKLLPLTGITLPFISYGGSSMVSSFISLGLLYALSSKER